MRGLFAEIYGHAADGEWQAPGRVNLIGEHTDYNGGLVLPFAIQRGTRALVRARDDDLVRAASLQVPADPCGPTTVETARLGELEPPGAGHWSAYVFGVLWAMRDKGLKRGADILIDGDVPVGAGLSSSASLECVVALAMSDLERLDITREELARMAQRAENEFAGVPCGIMDQYASLLCTRGHALLLDVRSGAARQVSFAPSDHGARLLVADTGARHALGESAYPVRLAECHQAARELGVPHLGDLAPGDLTCLLPKLSSDTLRRRVRHVVTEIDRVRQVVDILDRSGLEEIGSILTAGHRSLADDYQVSCPELDLAVSCALSAGAMGARMVGGGFGGSVIILVRVSEVDRVERSLAEGFASAGLPTPSVFSATPSGGATRLG